MDFRTRLTMETLDERIVPSQGQMELDPVAVSLPVRLSLPGLSDPLRPTANNGHAHDDDAESWSAIRHSEGESGEAGSPLRMNEQMMFTSLHEMHGDFARPGAIDESANHDSIPLKALTTIRDRARMPGIDDVAVPGSVAVEIRNDQMWLVATAGPRTNVPLVVPVGVTVESETPMALAPAAGSESRVVQVEMEAQRIPVSAPEAAPLPVLQPAQNLSKFVPVSTAAIEKAVRQFIQDLKSDEGSYLAFNGKTVAWASLLATGVFVGEMARRKRIPQKAMQLLSLSKFLTRTQTK